MQITINEKVRKDIINVLKNILKACKDNNAFMLKLLSDHTIHNAGIFQDEDSISIAVISYTLSKIMNEKNLNNFEFIKRFDLILKKITLCKNKITINDILGYRNGIKEVFSLLEKIEDKFGIFIRDVISQAKIRKASRIYEHGVSIGRVAELLKVPIWELTEYTGNTKAVDAAPLITIPTKNRVEFVKGLFKIK